MTAFRRLIIAGSRRLEDATLVERAMVQGVDVFGLPFEVVSGAARGIDMLGAAWARSRGIAVVEFPVTPEDWREHGKAAGPMRNRTMAIYAHALVLIWDGVGRGSANMKAEMQRLGKPVLEVLPW